MQKRIGKRHNSQGRFILNAKTLGVISSKRRDLNKYVLTSQGEIDILSRYILDYPNIETGGQLFGYWTFDGNPVILFVLGPGPNARHYDTFFMQDIEYLRERAKLLKSVYGLDHVGEWHSHHQLGLSRPSGHDSNNISKNMRKLGYSKFLLCIGTCTNTESMINAYLFNSSEPDYVNVPWLIKDIVSPFRTIVSANEGNYFIMPKVKTANMVNLNTIGAETKPTRIDYNNSYWLKKQGNPQVLKSILDFLNGNDGVLDFTPTVDKDNQVHIQAYSDRNLILDIHFPLQFPIEPPRIFTSTGFIYDDNSSWKYNGDILNSFVSFYNSFIERQKS